MANFDEISRTLGRMEGTLNGAVDKLDDFADRHENLNEEVIEMRGAIKLLATQQVETTKAVEDYKETKNRGIGIVAGLSIASGSIGAGVATLISRLFSGGPTLPPGHGG